MSHSQDKKTGKVYLVGAGPGDPGLITLRGAECLGLADLVLHDYLVNPRVLRHAAPAAELVCLGHHSKQRTVEQHDIKPLIDRRVPLAETPEAIRYIGEGHASGKVVITM